jgi:hypothetical protein
MGDVHPDIGRIDDEFEDKLHLLKSLESVIQLVDTVASNVIGEQINIRHLESLCKDQCGHTLAMMLLLLIDYAALATTHGTSFESVTNDLRDRIIRAEAL